MEKPQTVANKEFWDRAGLFNTPPNAVPILHPLPEESLESQRIQGFFFFV
jgi:hypothetical protein